MSQMEVTKNVRMCYALELKQNKAGLHSTLAYVSPMQSEQTWACGFVQTSQFMIQAVQYAIHGLGHAARSELSSGTLGRQKKYAIFYMPVRLR